MPAPAAALWRQRVDDLLFSQYYPLDRRAAVLAYCDAHGTAQGAPGLTDAMQVLVESLLPADPAWSLAAWDRVRFATAEGVGRG